MAPSSKTNFKSFEVQARLLRAIVAAHPEVKWNYKAIQQCYGTDISDHSLQHRFRPLKAQAEIIREGLKQKLDPKDLTVNEGQLPKEMNKIDRKNICKYFGESTADGIAFQFRSIKKDAQTLRTASHNGQNPATALDIPSSSAASTPTRGSRPASAKGTAQSASTRKRPVKTELSEIDGEEMSPLRYVRDNTPTPCAPAAKRSRTDSSQFSPATSFMAPAETVSFASTAGTTSQPPKSSAPVTLATDLATPSEAGDVVTTPVSSGPVASEVSNSSKAVVPALEDLGPFLMDDGTAWNYVDYEAPYDGLSFGEI